MVSPIWDRKLLKLLNISSGLPRAPPLAPPLLPPPYGSSQSDYPPPPSFPIELPLPSPSITPSSAFGFSSSIRFGPRGSGGPVVPPGLSSMSPTGGAPPARHVPNPTSTAAAPTGATHSSGTQKGHASPIFGRPVCNTCHVNYVNVREIGTNFCERCFQDALTRRGKKDSPKSTRPACRVCHSNVINVREGDTIYCERCWQETLRKRGIREDGSPWP